MATKQIRVGSKVTIPAGSQVTCRGEKSKRSVPSTVTVRAVEFTKAGNPKITWKSCGYMATTILKTK